VERDRVAKLTEERDLLRASHERLLLELELLRRRIFVAKAERVYERVRDQRGAVRSALGYAVRQKDALMRVLDDSRLVLESRVGDRRGGVQAALGCVRRFQLRARLERAITPSPVPASSNRTGGFPASGSPRRCHPVGSMIPPAWPLAFAR
jgi:hypothetical protein